MQPKIVCSHCAGHEDKCKRKKTDKIQIQAKKQSVGPCGYSFTHYSSYSYLYYSRTNSASAQNLHDATPLPCQSQGSHRGQSRIGMDREAVCQTDGPVPRSAVARTAPLSSAS